jgi:hypothetical protein
MSKLRHFAALLALSCGGELGTELESLDCGWPELIGECARFTGRAQFSLEGQQCEPASCLVVDRDAIQQVVATGPNFAIEVGPCSELLCP